MRPALAKRLPLWFARLMVACLALPAAAGASSITVGVPNTNNCILFSCPDFFAIDTYQQVYSSAAFSGTSTISAMTFFFLDPATLGTELASGTYSISFSTTTAGVDALSTTFAANVSGSSQAFFSGALPAPGPTSFTITGTPYLYHPALGNLLLTVNIAGATDAASPSFFTADFNGLVTSRAFGTSPAGTVDAIGLVTQFEVAPVPEPASVLLLGAGLAALVARRRLRRRQPLTSHH